MGVFVIYAYVLVTILTGIAAMMKGAVLPGIAGIVGGGMSAWAGSGLKGSLVVGDAGQRIAGALMAALFVSAGTGLAYYSGFRIGLWGVDFSGSAWCIVGLCIAYLFTADKFAEGTGGSGSRRQKMVASDTLARSHRYSLVSLFAGCTIRNIARLRAGCQIRFGHLSRCVSGRHAS